MTVINTNIGAITARTYASKAGSSMESSMERLSSGLRVNSGADDAAGLAVSNKMDAQIRSMDVAIRNASDGISLIQNAGSGMNKVNSMLIRIREVSVQMANGIYTDQDRANGQAEIKLLKEEIDKIAENLAFNEVKLLDGSYDSSFRTGVENAEMVDLRIISQRAEELGKREPGPDEQVQATQAASNTGRTEATNTGTSRLDRTEGTITINTTDLSTGLQVYQNAFTAGSFSLTGTDASSFTINATTGTITGTLDHESLADNNADGIYVFDVVFTDGTNTFTEAVRVKTLDALEGSSFLYDTAGNNNAITAVNLTTSGSGTSQAFRDFVAGDTGTGTFSLSGAAATAANLEISSSGVLSTTPSQRTLAGVHKFDVIYTHSDGTVFTESVSLTTNFDQDADTVMASSNTETLNGVPQLTSGTHTMAMSDFEQLSDFFAYERSLGNTVSVSGFTVTSSGAPGDFAATNSINTSGSTLAGTIDISKTDADGSVAFNLVSSGGATFSQTINLTIDFFYTGPPADQAGINISDMNNGFLNGNSFRPTQYKNITATEGQITINVSDLSEAFRGVVNAGGGGMIMLNNMDSAQFTLNATTNTVTATLDFENSTDVAGSVSPFVDEQANDNHYTFVLSYAGSAGTAVQIVKLTVADDTSDNRITNIRANGTAVSVDRTELNSFVTDAYDADQTAGSAGTFSISGADSSGFSINASTGTITATLDPDNPADADTNGVYVLNVTYTDSGGTEYGQIVNLKNRAAAAEPIADYAATASSQMRVTESSSSTIALSEFTETMNSFAGLRTGGTFAISGTDASKFTIDAATGALTSEAMNYEVADDTDRDKVYEFTVTYTQGDESFTETVSLTLLNDTIDDEAEKSVADVDVSTQAGATEAVEILDRAINQMSAQEARMGAAQNRLQYSINYLSMASMTTSMARGRIIDADFAQETSQLSKFQILNQAANAMLSQANASKDMVLTLLR